VAEATHYVRFKPVGYFQRPIVIIGSKAYPINKIEITTTPPVAFEDFIRGTYNLDATIVDCSIVSRGRRIPVKGVNPRSWKRSSGRPVIQYDE